MINAREFLKKAGKSLNLQTIIVQDMGNVGGVVARLITAVKARTAPRSLRWKARRNHPGFGGRNSLTL
jgi:glutamate dehydrogenase/leucine dehydrogenase